MTKHKGQAASYAPELGVVVPLDRAATGVGLAALAVSQTVAVSVAPAALLMSSTSAIAQLPDTCVEVAPNEFVCADIGDPATDTQLIFGDDVTVDLQDGFDIDTVVGDGITANTTNGISLVQAIGSGGISAADTGIEVINSISGAVTIAVAGPITAGSNGVDVTQNGTGDVNITTGDVTSLNTGFVPTAISAAITNPGGGDLNVDTTAGTVAGQFGIRLSSGGAGSIILNTADVLTDSNGIDVTASNAGGVQIDTTAGDVVAQSSTGIGIRNYGPGDVVLTTGNVSQLGGGTAIDIFGQAGSGSITIDTSAGTIESANTALFAYSFGTGDISVTTGDVTSFSGIFVGASSASTVANVSVDTSAGALDFVNGSLTVRNYSSAAEVTRVVTGSVSNRSPYSNGYGVNVRAGGTDVIVDTSAGAISSTGTGVYVRNVGTGFLSITTADVSSTSGQSYVEGISAYNAGTDLTIDSSAGSVSAQGGRGIYARNAGTGSLSIVSASVTSANSDGIYARSYGTSLTIDTSAGDVSGARYGISASNRGSGNLSITTADVSSTGLDAIFVFNEAGGDSLIIDTTAGSVDGVRNGIFASNRGRGDLFVSTADVTAQLNNGVRAIGTVGSGSVTVDTSAGVVATQSAGVTVSHNGIGDVTLITGDVTSNERNAVSASIDGASGDLGVDTTAGRIQAELQGLNVNGSASGIVQLTTGDVTSLSNQGIFMIAQGDLLADTSAGSVTGTSGIVALGRGAGSMSLVTGSVAGTAGDGVTVSGGADTGDISVDTTAGSVTGATNAIGLINRGAGNVTVLTGDVSGAAYNGVYALSYGQDLAVDTSAGTATGNGRGVLALNNGTGALSITTADATGTTGDGVLGRNLTGGTDLSIDTSAGSVMAEVDGVEAINYGTGSVSVVTGAVTANTDDGIYARNEGTSVTIDSSAGAVMADGQGIEVRQNGSGDVSVTTADVTSMNVEGIQVFNSTASGSITIDTSAGSVSGVRTGIAANNLGSGSTTVITGDVTAQTYTGIAAGSPYGTGKDLIIDTTAGTVSAPVDAILAYNRGTGITQITTGDLIGTLRLDQDGSDASIDTSAGNVDGRITVRNYGSGTTTITTAGVSTDADDGIEITALERTGSVSIDTTAGDVAGGFSGIDARKTGDGDLEIASANVAGGISYGIEARKTGFGSDGSVSINTTAGTVTSSRTAILARNEGTGSLTITTANVETTGNTRDGINAVNYGTDLIIDTSAGIVSSPKVPGAFYLTYGVRATQSGTGTLEITTADIAADVAVSGSVSVGDAIVDTRAGTLTGQFNGISFRNSGAGSATITTADILFGENIGIFANGVGSGLTIDTSAGSITGGSSDIQVFGRQQRLFGSSGITVIGGTYGDVSITTADITTPGAQGIEVDRAGDTVMVNTVAGSISSGGNGIRVRGSGAGAISITSADVTGSLNVGIYARGDGTSLTIDSSAGSVSGGNRGIEARNDGSGPTTITVNDVTGLASEGIRARNNAADTAITVQGSSGDVVGATDGIYLRSVGGVITVQRLDSVTGQAGDGLDLASLGGAITVNDIGAITGEGGFGILALSEGGTTSIQGVGLVGGISGTSGSGISVDARGGSG
ncbi:MAG: hypothetical protein AAFN48_02130, partial [Pseudomonadota bacterium]